MSSARPFWEIFSRFGIVSPRYFPAPTTIAWALADRLVAGDLGGDLLVTLIRLAFAFALAAVPAVPLGLLMGIARPVRDLVEPYLAFIFPVPKITLLPFLMIILGVGEPAFVLTGASSAFFQIVISTLAGVQTMDPRLIEVGRNYGAHGPRLFWKVILPAALPAIFTGLRPTSGWRSSRSSPSSSSRRSRASAISSIATGNAEYPEMYAAFALVGGSVSCSRSPRPSGASADLAGRHRGVAARLGREHSMLLDDDCRREEPHILFDLPQLRIDRLCRNASGRVGDIEDVGGFRRDRRPIVLAVDDRATHALVVPHDHVTGEDGLEGAVHLSHLVAVARCVDRNGALQLRDVMAGRQDQRLHLGDEVGVDQECHVRQALSLRHDRLDLKLHMVRLPNRL